MKGSIDPGDENLAVSETAFVSWHFNGFTRFWETQKRMQSSERASCGRHQAAKW
ncbi:hypothetical protein HMPREF0576_1315 [Mobiluncus holmesii ATCC 35242]|uniref:Uncharacterized protein n=1 Tax=Mobiluncus holmesii ATCC 35242 TaxID=887899 RepID=E6M4S5_9ACTO|nr:hypothetical protein HMPREF0576_1315 [Mobiluncus holmesii ATCC 35242]